MKLARVIRCTVLAGVAIAAASNSEVRAQTPAISFSNANAFGLGNPPLTIGYQFNVTQAISVTSLGLFDGLQDGLFDSHGVGIWTSAGALLGTATVGSGLSVTLINDFRYVGVAPLLLGIGTYQIGALFSTGGHDQFFTKGSALGFSTASEITLVDSRVGFGATLANPTLALGPDQAFFGPNFLFTNASANANVVPEPSTYLLMSAGLAALALGARRKRRTTL